MLKEVQSSALKKAAEVKAISLAMHMSVDELIRQARPPKWKFWIGEIKRVAAVEVMSDMKKGDPRVLGCLCEVARNDASPSIKRLAIISLASFAGQPNDTDAVVATLKEILVPSQNEDVAIQAIRSMGLVGERRHGVEMSIRSYIQVKKTNSSEVNPRLFLWANFVEAKFSADPAVALAAIQKVLEEDVYRAAIKAAETAPKAGSLPMDQLGSAIALAREVDYDLIDQKEIETMASSSKAWKIPLLVAATYAAKRKVEALEAAARLGDRGRSLLDPIRKLLASNPPPKMKGFIERALSEIAKA